MRMRLIWISQDQPGSASLMMRMRLIWISQPDDAHAPTLNISSGRTLFQHKQYCWQLRVRSNALRNVFENFGRWFRPAVGAGAHNPGLDLQLWASSWLHLFSAGTLYAPVVSWVFSTPTASDPYFAWVRRVVWCHWCL
jgi:hypothetical protein